MRRRSTLAAVVIVAVVLISGLAVHHVVKRHNRSSATDRSRPNVLLICIDTLRPDHLTCYGYERRTSPNLDKLAAEGVLFESHISSTSWTLPAHAALFTSLPDSVHGCTDTDKRLDDSFVTLAEAFAAAGYSTAGFFSGPYLHPAFGLSQGFAHYEDCTSFAGLIDDVPVAQWAEHNGVMQLSHHDVTNPIVYAAFRKWLAKNRDSNFFTFLHLWDPHFDYAPPPPYDTMFDPDYTGSISGVNYLFDQRINADMPARDLQHLIALYDGEIAWTDHYLGLILRDLEKAGLLDNTIVAITSDHGEEFFEHGSKTHRETLFDEVIRVPLVIRYPAKLPAGSRVRAQTRSIDVAPTLLELVGLPAMENVMGASLLDLATGKETVSDNVAISELFSLGRRMRTIRSPEWKLTDHLNLNRRYFINLVDDPGERNCLTDLAQEPGNVLLTRYQAVSAELIAHRSRWATHADRSTIPDDVLKQLMSLGYLGQ
ncbi:MAG: sulfatase [Planctomycetes bacterium]|nr:sulfatase [Planctomycetota bacterium]